MITASVDIPDNVFLSMAGFLDTHPSWSMNQVSTAALCLFLLQNSDCDRSISETYVSVFPIPAVSNNLLDNPQLAASLQPPAKAVTSEVSA